MATKKAAPKKAAPKKRARPKPQDHRLPDHVLSDRREEAVGTWMRLLDVQRNAAALAILSASEDHPMDWQQQAAVQQEAEFQEERFSKVCELADLEPAFFEREDLKAVRQVTVQNQLAGLRQRLEVHQDRLANPVLVQDPNVERQNLLHVQALVDLATQELAGLEATD